jgi:phenylacetic acid degradation operon negative regulatory protein
VLFVTIPHALRATRKRLYRDLTWAGFGNPSAGVWLSPHPERRAQVAALIDDLGLTEYTLSFVGKADSVGLSEKDIVRQGWDLTDLAARYAAVDEEFGSARPQPGDDTLFTHLRLLGAWQRFPFSDPQLPEALAPQWIGREVSSHIEALRARWSHDAHARWAEINGGTAPTA